MACGDNILTQAACNIGNGVNDITTGVTDTVEGVVTFAQNPYVATLNALKDGAKSLTSDLLPTLTTAIQPDLSSGFFINAYRISFGAAVFAMVLILVGLMVRTAKGEMAGRDLAQSLFQYTPMFLIGAMFGPLAGIALVGLFHALTNAVIAWGTAGQADAIVNTLLALFDDMDPTALPGGVILAIILMLLMLVGLVIVLVILICQLVTLYFTGIIIPLFLVFMIDPERRQMALGFVGLWVGILAAHPLLFFFLGFAFSIMADTLLTIGDGDGLQMLVTFIVALIAIYMAALSPLALMKFAPALQGVSMPKSNGGGGGGGRPIGHKNLTDATNEYGNGGRESNNTTTTQSTMGVRNGSAASSTEATDNPLSNATAANESAPTSREKDTAGAGSAGGGSSSASKAESAESGGSVLANAGAAKSSASAGAAAAEAEGAAATGGATLLVEAGVSAAQTAKKGADGAVAQATAPMDDNTLGGSST